MSTEGMDYEDLRKDNADNASNEQTSGTGMRQGVPVKREKGNVDEQSASNNNENDLKKMDTALKVLSLAVLQSKGVKIARLEGNRDLNEKAIKAKMKSMKLYGQLVPAIVVDAATARKQGLKLVDFVSGEEVNDENEKEYIVLLDANHRYEAHLRLVDANKDAKTDDEKYNEDFYFVYALKEDVAIDKALAEINIATTPWKGADYVKGVKMMVEEDLPVVDFIAELTAEGLSLDAGSKVALFNGKVNKTILVKAINGEIDDCLKCTTGLERGRKIFEAAKVSFGMDFLKSRTWIDWVISKYDKTLDADKGNFTDIMTAFLSSIERKKADEVEKAKGKRGSKTKETIINELLDKLWKDRK